MQTNTPTTTASHPFFSSSSGQEDLFAVLPGVAAIEALETASCLLSVAHTCAFESTETENLANAAAYLTDMAKAVIDSVMLGSKARSNDSDSAHVFERLAELRKNGVLIINPDASGIEREDAKGFLCWAGELAKGGAA